jgi:DNA ligase-1
MYSQVKMDGRYCNGIIKDGKAVLLSRGGEITYVGNAKFLSEMAGCPDMVLNGELTMSGIPRYTANGIISSICSIEGKKGERDASTTIKKIAQFELEHGPYQEMLDKIIFTVWDMVTLDEYDDMTSSIPYFKRLEFLQEYIKDNNFEQIAEVEWKFVYSFKEALDHFQEALERGDEGTIIKTFDGEWKKGKPKWQMKMKKEDYHDLKAVAFNYGTVGSKNEHVISSVTVESEDGLIRTKAGGMTEEDMKYVTENQDEVLGQIIETKCSGLSQNRQGEYALLHPVFIKIRDDKTIANTLEECIAINNMINELN